MSCNNLAVCRFLNPRTESIKVRYWGASCRSGFIKGRSLMSQTGRSKDDIISRLKLQLHPDCER